MKTVLTIIGTRPEAIKLSPLIAALDKNKFFINQVCVTNQHQELLDDHLVNLGINITYLFKVTRKDNTLYESIARILQHCGELFTKTKPDLVVVQGDTSTAFAATLAAFYVGIPVAHVEAGLRTGNLYAPWPEEAHRCLIDKLASYYFAPTMLAKDRLIAEGVLSGKIWVVGNTSIDAIRLMGNIQTTIQNSLKSRLIIVTIHRRENHGEALREICYAITTIAKQFPDIKIIFILHPNPAVRVPALQMLSNIPNVVLFEPMNHYSFVQLMRDSYFIITDSGGIQEEISFIGKPAIVIRGTTERPENIDEGTIRLINAKAANIIAGCRELLENESILENMSIRHYPYGDGHAADRIVDILETELRKSNQ
jgi:UDP-N-acetylglucosamine 2-epimerase (non-hydrolysing)